MKARSVSSCVIAMLLISGCAAHRVVTAVPPAGSMAAPVVVAEAVREARPDDYLRIIFVPAGVTVTSVAKPGALRGFATATAIYSPPLKLEDFPYYSGLVYDDQETLVAMRCRPPNPEKVDAVLATWPNVFAAVQRDVPLAGGDCDSSPPDPDKQVACFAKGFSDPAGTVVPTSLAHTFGYAGTLFDAGHTTMAKWLQQKLWDLSRVRRDGLLGQGFLLHR